MFYEALGWFCSFSFVGVSCCLCCRRMFKELPEEDLMILWKYGCNMENPLTFYVQESTCSMLIHVAVYKHDLIHLVFKFIS